MALNKDFKVTVSVEDKGSKPIKDIGISSEKTSDVIKNLEKTLASVNDTLRAAQFQFDNAARATKNASVNTKQFNKVLRENQGVLKREASLLSGVATNFGQLSQGIAATRSNLEAFLDPDFLAKLSNMAVIVSALADLKGFDNLSNNLLDFSDKVNEINTQIIKFRDEADRNFESAAHKARFVSDTFASVFGLMSEAVISFFKISPKNINKSIGFDELQENLDNSLPAIVRFALIMRTVGEVINSATKSVANIIGAITRLKVELLVLQIRMIEALKDIRAFGTVIGVFIAKALDLASDSLSRYVASLRNFFKASSVGAARADLLSMSIRAIGEAFNVPIKNIDGMVIAMQELRIITSELSRGMAGSLANILKAFLDSSKGPDAINKALVVFTGSSKKAAKDIHNALVPLKFLFEGIAASVMVNVDFMKLAFRALLIEIQSSLVKVSNGASILKSSLAVVGTSFQLLGAGIGNVVKSINILIATVTAVPLGILRVGMQHLGIAIVKALPHVTALRVMLQHLLIVLQNFGTVIGNAVTIIRGLFFVLNKEISGFLISSTKVFATFSASVDFLSQNFSDKVFKMVRAIDALKGIALEAAKTGLRLFANVLIVAAQSTFIFAGSLLVLAANIQNLMSFAAAAVIEGAFVGLAKVINVQVQGALKRAIVLVSLFGGMFVSQLAFAHAAIFAFTSAGAAGIDKVSKAVFRLGDALGIPIKVLDNIVLTIAEFRQALSNAFGVALGPINKLTAGLDEISSKIKSIPLGNFARSFSEAATDIFNLNKQASLGEKTLAVYFDGIDNGVKELKKLDEVLIRLGLTLLDDFLLVMSRINVEFPRLAKAINSFGSVVVNVGKGIKAATEIFVLYGLSLGAITIPAAKASEALFKLAVRGRTLTDSAIALSFVARELEKVFTLTGSAAINLTKGLNTLFNSMFIFTSIPMRFEDINAAFKQFQADIGFADKTARTFGKSFDVVQMSVRDGVAEMSKFRNATDLFVTMFRTMKDNAFAALAINIKRAGKLLKAFGKDVGEIAKLMPKIFLGIGFAPIEAGVNFTKRAIAELSAIFSGFSTAGAASIDKVSKAIFSLGSALGIPINILDNIVATVIHVRQVFSDFVGQAVNKLKQFSDAIAKGALVQLNALGSMFSNIASKATSFFNSAISQGSVFIETMKTTATAVSSSFTTAFTAITARVKALGPIMVEFASVVGAQFGKVIGFAGKVGSGVASIGKALATVPISPILNLVDSLSLLTIGFEVIGSKMAESESVIISFTGKVLLLASAITNNMVLGIKSAITTVGDFVIAVGEKMLSAVVDMAIVSEKANLSLKKFTFTIGNFAKFAGSEGVGSVDSWNAAVDRLRATTSFSAIEIRNAISMLVKEANILHLSTNETNTLLERSAEIASANSVSIVDATKAIIGGLTGQSTSLLNLGVDLRESTVAHGDLGAKLKSFNEEQRNAALSAARYNEILKQTKPLLGASALLLDTLTGQQKRYVAILEQVEVELGKTAPLLVDMAAGLNDIFQATVEATKPILGLAGALSSFVGVGLIVFGMLVKYTLVIGSVTFLIKALSVAISTNVAIQNLLTATFAKTNTIVGAQAVAVTGLTSVWTNFLHLIRGGLMQFLPLLKQQLLNMVTAVTSLTIATAKLIIPYIPLIIKLTALGFAIKGIIDLFIAFKDTLGPVGQALLTLAAIGTSIGVVYTLFNIIVMKSTAIQASLTIATWNANAAFGTQTILVTNATSAFKALNIVMLTTIKRGIIAGRAALISLGVALKALVAGLAAVAVPLAVLLAKIVAIAAVIAAVIKAVDRASEGMTRLISAIQSVFVPIRQLGEAVLSLIKPITDFILKIPVLGAALKGVGGAFSSFIDWMSNSESILDDLLDLLGQFVELVVGALTVAILGTVNNFLMLSNALIELKLLITDEEEAVKELNKALLDNELALKENTAAVDLAIARVTFYGDETKIATYEQKLLATQLRKTGDAAKEAIKKFSKQELAKFRGEFNKVAEEIKKVEDDLFTIGKSQLDIVVERSLSRIAELDAIAQALRMSKKFTAEDEAQLVKVKELIKARAKAAVQQDLNALNDQRVAKAKELFEQNRNISRENQLAALKDIELIKQKTKFALKDIDIKELELKRQNLLTGEVRRNLEVQRLLVKEQSKINIGQKQLDLQKATNKEAIKGADDNIKKLETIINKNKELEKQLKSINVAEVKKAEISLDFALAAVEAEKAKIDVNKEGAEFAIASLNKQKELITKIAAQQQKAAVAADLKNVVGQNIALGNELLSVGMDQNDLIDFRLQLLSQEIEARKQAANIKFGEAGAASIVAALEKQKQLMAELADASKEFDLGDISLGDIGSALKDSILFMEDNLDPVMNAFADGIGSVVDAVDFDNLSLDGIGDTLSDAADGLMGSLQDIDLESVGADLKEMGTDAALAFVDMLSKITLEDVINSVQATLSTIGGLLSGDFVNEFADVVSSFGNMPEQLMEAFENLDKIIVEFINKLPAIVDRLLTELPKIIQKIAEALPKLIQMLAAALPKIFQVLMEALPQIIQVILDSLPLIIQAMANAITILIEALPGIITQLLEALPSIITSLLEAFPQIINALISAIPAIIVAFLENIPAIVEAFITGMIGSLGEIIAGLIDTFITKGGALKIAVALIKAIVMMIPAIIKGIINGLTKGMGAIFNGLPEIKLPKEISELPEKIGEGAKKLGKDLTGEASKLFAVKNLEDATAGVNIKDPTEAARKAVGKITDAIVGLNTRMKNLWDKFLDLLKDLWMWIFKGLQKIWEVVEILWKKVIMPIMQFFVDALAVVWEEVVKPIMQFFIDILELAWKGIVRLINNWVVILKVAWDLIVGYLTGWLVILKAAWDLILIYLNTWVEVLKAAWDLVVSVLKKFFDDTIGALKNAWDNLMSSFRIVIDFLKNTWNTLMAIFQGKISLFEGISRIFGDMFNAAKGLFDNLINSWRGMFQPIINAFNGIVSGFDSILNPVVAGLKSAANVFGDAFTSLGGIFDDTIKPIFETFTSGFSGAINAIKAPINAFINMLKALKLQEVKVGGKVLGRRFEFTLIPNMQLIPGIEDVPTLAKGGVIPGSASVPGDSITNDKILALLSPGEAVIPRSLMDNETIGGIIRDILSGSFASNLVANNLPEFADGGLMPQTKSQFSSEMRMPVATAPSMAFLRNSPMQKGGITVGQITINAKTNLDAASIKREIVPTIHKELLRKSQDGERVLSPRGVRN